MSQQLAYVIITPYSLHKSRTGGILARLISRTGLELLAARMFGASQLLVEEYSKVVISAADPQDRKVQQLIHDYIVQQLGPDPKTNRRRRAMMLLFRGEDAVRKVRSVFGNISHASRSGESIRDTFGDTDMLVRNMEQGRDLAKRLGEILEAASPYVFTLRLDRRRLSGLRSLTATATSAAGATSPLSAPLLLSALISR